MSYDPGAPTPGTSQTTPMPEQQASSSHRPAAGVMTPHGRPGVYIYPFWQRTEFWVMALISLAILIATAIEDGFPAQAGWTLITVLGAAYIVSRGLAKREPRDDGDDRPWTPGN
jgi:hypothetical protein